MGWNPIEDIADAFKSGIDAIGDFFSDPLGAVEDLFTSALDIMTLGAFSYAKDQLLGLFDFDIPYEDRNRMVRSATGARQIVYGKTLVGGQLVYIESWFTDRRFLTLTLVVATHQVEEITAVYADGRKVASARSSGNGRMPIVNDGKFNRSGQESRLFCWSAKGDQTAAILPTVTPGGVSSNPPGWTSAHKLLGQAYVHIFCWYHEDIFETGIPKFEVEVKGKNDIYDPRTGATGYTDNQALCVLDALRWSRLFGVPDADIDMAAFEAAANIADQSVTTGTGTEKRYTVNGSIPFDRTPLEVIQSLSKAGAGFPVYSQGQWTYVPGAYTAPVMSLNESDLVGGLSFQPGPGKSARHNKATGTYIDASQNFELVEFSQLIVSAYIADDLEELEKSYKFALTNSGTMARRLAKIDIERNRFGLTVQLAAKFRALRLTPGDRINLSIANLGWTNKVFRVESSEFSFSSGVKLTLREDAPEIYDWTEGDVLALDPPPTINLPEGLEISAPTGLNFSEELYQTLTRAAVKVRLIASWDADDNNVAKAYDIQYRKTGNPTWVSAATFWQSNTIEIDDVEDASYDVRVRAINTIGSKSDWLQDSHTVIGKSAAPPDVTVLLVEKGVLRWEYSNAPLDLAGFRVRFQNGDRPIWADATPMHDNLLTETVFDISQYGGTKTFLIKAVDTTGNESTNAAVLLAGLNDVAVANVIETVTQAALMWPGTLTGGFINASNELEANELGQFWGEPNSLFWALDTTTQFYSAEYERLEYVWTYAVSAGDAGAAMTVGSTLDGAQNSRIEYKPPGYTGSFLAFPGSVPTVEGTYTFRIVVPNQQSGTAPTVSDLVVRLDVEDINESFNDFAISAGGSRLPITKSYREIKNVSLTLQADGGSAVNVFYVDKDKSLGPLVEARNSSGTSVAATVDARVQGY